MSVHTRTWTHTSRARGVCEEHNIISKKNFTDKNPKTARGQKNPKKGTFSVVFLCCQTVRRRWRETGEIKRCVASTDPWRLTGSLSGLWPAERWSAIISDPNPLPPDHPTPRHRTVNRRRSRGLWSMTVTSFSKISNLFPNCEGRHDGARGIPFKNVENFIPDVSKILHKGSHAKHWRMKWSSVVFCFF